MALAEVPVPAPFEEVGGMAVFRGNTNPFGRGAEVYRGPQPTATDADENSDKKGGGSVAEVRPAYSAEPRDIHIPLRAVLDDIEKSQQF